MHDGRHHRRAWRRCVVVHLVICGSGSEESSVLFEPFGAEYVLAPEDHLLLDVELADDSAIEVAAGDGCQTLWFPPSVVNIRAVNRLGDTIDLGPLL